jgi:two-component system response regulator CpxR
MGTAPTALCGVAGEFLRLFHHLHRPMEWTPGVRPKNTRDSSDERPDLCQNTVDGWWDNRNANPGGEPTRRSARTPELGLNWAYEVDAVPPCLPAGGDVRNQQQTPDRGLQKAPENPGEEKNAMRPRKTIVCVEDNEQVLSVRRFLLETRGYRVVACTTAAEALDYLQGTMPGEVDLLMSDVLMPQMDGNELVRRAKQMLPGLPTLLVSGTVTSGERALAADAFLPKGGCTPAEVLDRIRILVARKRGPKKQVQSVGMEAAQAGMARQMAAAS